MQYNLTMTSAAAAAVFAHETRLESQRASSYAWAIVAVWLASTAYAFWSFELRQQRSFESAHSSLFDSGARASSAESWFRTNVAAAGSAASVATVVHIYAPGCSCNQFTHPHLQRIVARYQSHGVSFVAAERDGAAAAGGGGPAGIRHVALRRGGDLSWIEATPAAMVFDAHGKLVYFGPYSDSARCGDTGGLVEGVLDRMLRGQGNTLQPFYGGGCFCNGQNDT